MMCAGCNPGADADAELVRWPASPPYDEVGEDDEENEEDEDGQAGAERGQDEDPADHVVDPREPVQPRPAEPGGFAPGAVRFVVLPDTQHYAQSHPAVFDIQTAWTAQEAEALAILRVFHVGDIVNDHSSAEWGRARAAMARLDGVVPYVLVPGNHDYEHVKKTMTRTTALNEWFTHEDAAQQPGFGGAREPGRLENTYHLFAAGGHDWIALALEWGPRDEVVAWANEVMDAHPERLGVLVTHAYLHEDGRRYDQNDPGDAERYNPHRYDVPGGVNDGEELWQKLVRRHRFVLTLSGHALGDGAGYLASETDLGNICHQMLANYQMRDLGGEGYLRILELHPDDTVAVRTYSPLFKTHLRGPEHEFSFALDVDP